MSDKHRIDRPFGGAKALPMSPRRPRPSEPIVVLPRLLVVAHDLVSFEDQISTKNGAQTLFVPTSRPLQLGDDVTVEVALAKQGTSVQFPGRVVWYRRGGRGPIPGGVGVQAKGEFDLLHCLWSSPSQRPRRHGVLLSTVVLGDTGPQIGLMKDVSSGGAYVSCAEPPEVGERIELQVGAPGLPAVKTSAVCVRRDSFAGFGLRFEQHPAELEQLLVWVRRCADGQEVVEA